MACAEIEKNGGRGNGGASAPGLSSALLASGPRETLGWQSLGRVKAENAKVKRLLADAMLDNTKKGDARCPFLLGYRSPREYILSRPAACPL